MLDTTYTTEQTRVRGSPGCFPSRISRNPRWLLPSRHYFCPHLRAEKLRCIPSPRLYGLVGGRAEIQGRQPGSRACWNALVSPTTMGCPEVCSPSASGHCAAGAVALQALLSHSDSGTQCGSGRCVCIVNSKKRQVEAEPGPSQLQGKGRGLVRGGSFQAPPLASTSHVAPQELGEAGK